MKNILTLSALILIGMNALSAQDNMISIIKAVNEQPEVLKGVKQLVETTYTMSNYTEAEPDSTLIINGDSVDLFMESYSVVEFVSDFETITKTYDSSKKLILTGNAGYNDSGKMMNYTEMYADPALTEMNSMKEFKYDEKNRIVNIVQNGTNLMSMSFLEDNIVDELNMDAGMMVMKSKMNKLGDTMRYEANIEFSGPFAKMMGEKEMPREYSDLFKEGENLRLKNYKGDEEGNIKLEGEFLYDSKLNILEEKYSQYSMDTHYSYEYSEDGLLLKKIDMLEGQELIWEYDENNNLVSGYENFENILYKYDEKGNLVSKLRSSEDGSVLMGLVTKEITYKVK